MNEEDKKQAPEVEAPPVEGTEDHSQKPVQKVRTGRMWAALAFIFSITALGTTGYLGYIYYNKKDLFNTDVLGTLSRLQADTQQIQEGRSAIEENLKGVGKELEEFKQVQDTLGTAVEKMVSDLGRNRSDWVLSETEQLLLIANHRLQLAHDIDTAVAALRAADRRLQQLADPSLLPVRKLLATEIVQLQALERADVPGIALKLGSLAKILGQLPLDVERRFRSSAPSAPSQEAAGETSTGWHVLSQMWHDLRGLVRIRKNTESQKPLLAPEQAYFLRENLRLMLYGAQLAVLQGNVTTYGQNIKSAQSWINDYFDTDSRAVMRFQEELQRLANAKIVIELPDISASLEALRAAESKKADSQLQAGQ